MTSDNTFYLGKNGIYKHLQKHRKKYLRGAFSGAMFLKFGAIILTGLGIYSVQWKSFADITDLQFNHVQNAEIDTEYLSDTKILAGMASGQIISINNGYYSINGDARNNTTGTVAEGDMLQLKGMSSSDYDTEVIVTVQIGELNSDFKIKTKFLIDDFADPIERNNITEAELSTIYYSEEAKITGINTGVSLTVQNGEAQVNSGEWFGVGRGDTIYSGDTIRVRSTSESEYDSTTITTVQLGPKTIDFVIQTKPEGEATATTTPIMFEAITGADLNTTYQSNQVTINGLNTGTNVFVSENLEYQINNTGRTHSGTIVENDDVLTLRMTSSQEYQTTRTGTVTIGEENYTFVITTTEIQEEIPDEIPDEIIYDTTVDEISFQAIEDAEPNTEVFSEEIEISGIDTGIIINMNNGEYQINSQERISGDSQTLVYNGDVLRIKVTSPADYEDTKLTRITLGEENIYFRVSTMAAPILEDTEYKIIQFTEVRDAELDTEYTSDVVVISGINTGLTLAPITNASYKINSGERKTTTSFLYNQDNLQLRLTSADQYNTTSIARITINDDLYSFYVTTKEEPTNTGSDDTDLTGTFVDYNTGETVETETGDLIEGSTGDLIETDTDTTSITGDLEAPILETMTVLGSGNTIMLSGTMNEPSKIGVYYTGENITGEYFSGNEYTTGLQIQLENIVLDTKYQFDIILKDSGDNRSHWTGMRKLLSGDIVETGSRAETGTATNITNSEKYREIFKNELKQYQQCKKTIASQKITMHIQNKNYSIEVPEFQSEFLANISSIFSRIILQAVEQQNLSQQETKEVLDNFSNFLMVMKILRDGDTDCSHHLSNYYITKFHESLAEYGVFLK